MVAWNGKAAFGLARPGFAAALCLGLLAALAPSAGAVALDRALDRHWAKYAELIAAGEVVDVEYRSAKPDGGGEEAGRAIPHTFVTVEVQEVLKGKLEDKLLVLRFLGGRGEEAEFLRVGGIPLFDRGDRGVFFVRGNGIRACPLVGWRQGWTRFVEGMAHGAAGEDLLLAGDPLLAARIHPMDILDPVALYRRLADPQRSVDKLVLGELRPETRRLLESPGSLPDLDPAALGAVFPEAVLGELDRYEGGDLMARLMPPAHRAAAKSPGAALLFRDLNLLLLRRDLLGPDALGGVAIRPETEKLLGQDPRELPLELVLLRNRRILEDAYPDLLVRSLDQSIVPGGRNDLEEAVTHQVSETSIRVAMPPAREAEGPAPDPDPLPEGKRLDAAAFLERVAALVEALHTPEELEKLPPVRSASPDGEILLAPLRPLAPLAAPVPDRPGGGEDAKELEAFLESGGSPVIGGNR